MNLGICYIHAQLGFSSLSSGAVGRLAGDRRSGRLLKASRLFEVEGACLCNQKYKESHPILKELYRNSIVLSS